MIGRYKVSELILTSRDWFEVIQMEPLLDRGQVRVTINGAAKVVIILTAAAAEDMGERLAIQGSQSRVQS